MNFAFSSCCRVCPSPDSGLVAQPRCSSNCPPGAQNVKKNCRQSALHPWNWHFSQGGNHRQNHRLPGWNSVGSDLVVFDRRVARKCLERSNLVMISVTMVAAKPPCTAIHLRWAIDRGHLWQLKCSLGQRVGKTGATKWGGVQRDTPVTSQKLHKCATTLRARTVLCNTGSQQWYHTKVSGVQHNGLMLSQVFFETRETPKIWTTLRNLKQRFAAMATRVTSECLVLKMQSTEPKTKSKSRLQREQFVEWKEAPKQRNDNTKHLGEPQHVITTTTTTTTTNTSKFNKNGKI